MELFQGYLKQMPDYIEYEGLFFKNEKKVVLDAIPVEAPLEISINGNPFTVVMQTPGDELHLALGLLFAEDVFDKNTEYNYFYKEQRINFIVDPSNLRSGYLSARSLLSMSSCGICGKQSLEDIDVKGNPFKDDVNFSNELIPNLFDKLKNQQELFKKTGGTHAIALFNENGNLLSIKEDVGRHNAVDKTIGELILLNQLEAAKILICSGRVSYEIVSKAFRARIPVIAAVSSPTSLAIDFAKEYGITLIGFSREKKFTCYANPFRITA